MAWEDLPLWFRQWWRYRIVEPPAVAPPGPSPTGGPAIPPAVHTAETAGLDANGRARRGLAPLGDTLVALPLRPRGTTTISPAETGTETSTAALATPARVPLTLDPVPTTPPILADAPTFYARGEAGEPDLVGGRQVRAHGAVAHPAGVDTDPDDGAVGTAYRGGTGGDPGDFHVDTTDGWIATPHVSFEAWIRPATLTGDQSFLDARTVHQYYGDRWLWTVTRTLLGQLVTALADILGDYDPRDDWPAWRGYATFLFWQAWWTRAQLQVHRQHMGWELHAAGGTLHASFGAGYGTGTVSVAGRLTAGQWTHVAATCDGPTRRLYVDGALAATVTVPVGGQFPPPGYVPAVPGVDLVIGRGSSNAAAIDEVAVYDHVLPADRIAAHRTGLGGDVTRGLPDTLVALPLRPVTVRAIAPATDQADTLEQRVRGRHPVTPAVARLRALPLATAPTDQALLEAVNDELRRPVYSVRADWYRDGTFAHPLSDLTELVEELSIDRSIGGDLPAEVGLVDGAASAAMNLKIAGQWDTGDGADGDTGITGPGHPESLDAVAAFAPYNPDAPLFGYPTIGTPVEADIGFLTRLGPDKRRRFTGTVSRVNPSSRDRNVAIDALDGANRMRAPITQQATGMDATMLARFGPERYNSRTNSHWLVDRCFRANGYYASPPPQPYSFISATCHGSLIPELGGGGVPRRANYVTPSNPDQWVGGGPYGDHPHRMMYANPQGIKQYTQWTSPEVLSMIPGTGFGCTFLAQVPSDPRTSLLMDIILDGGGPSGPNGGYAGTYAILVTLEAGAPTLFTYTPADGLRGCSPTTWTRPSKPTWMPIGMHWSFRPPSTPGTSLTQNKLVDVVMTLFVNGQTYTTKPAVTMNIGNVRVNPWSPSTTVECSMGIPMTNVSWFRQPTSPGPGEWTVAGHVSQADVDPGLNELYGIPQISGEDSWELVTEVAAAEAAQLGVGGVLFDRPYFRSRAVARDRSDPTPLTSDRELAGMVTVTDEASVRNSISAAVTPLLVGDYEWVKESKDATEFESGPGTSYFKVPLPPDTVLVEPWDVLQLKTRVFWEAFADHPVLRDCWLLQVVYADNPKQVVGPGLMYLGLYPGGPGEVIVAVYNYSGRTIRFATEDVLDSQGVLQPGSAAFKLPGKLLKAQATVPQDIVDPGSVAMFGPRTHDLGQSRWHQHPRAVQGVAEAILTTTAHPAPVLDTVTVRHNPLRDLDDPVRLIDPHGLGSVRGAVTGITTTLNGSSAVLDELTVRPIAPPGFGVLDDSELGRVGETLRFGA